MRIRTIKPEFWEDEKIGNLSHGARLLFLCSLNLCDDEGYLRWNAFFLASHAFMYDDIKLETIEKWMIELINNDLVYIYAAGKVTIAHVKNFHKHQRIDKPQPSKYAELDPRRASQKNSENDSENDSENSSKSDSLKEKEKEYIYLEKEINKEKDSGKSPSSTLDDQKKKEKSSAKKEKDRYDLSFVEARYQEVFTKWMEYKQARKESYKNQQSLEQCYKNMIRDCGDDPQIAMEMCNRSMGNNWSGMFPLRGNVQVTSVKPKSEVEKAIESHNKAFGNKSVVF